MAASMFRQFLGRCISSSSCQGLQTCQAVRPLLMSQPQAKPLVKCLSSCVRQTASTGYSSAVPAQIKPASSTTSPLLTACQPYMNNIRTLVRYSIRRGKPKPNKAVIGRFFRLGWGIYIRPRAGRSKRLWTKPDWIIEKGKYHVFCNKQQSKMLDKMTTRYWKKRRYYVDDPYQPYHQRPGPAGQEKPRFFP